MTTDTLIAIRIGDPFQCGTRQRVDFLIEKVQRDEKHLTIGFGHQLIVDGSRFDDVALVGHTKTDLDIGVVTSADAFLTIERLIGRLDLHQALRRLFDIFAGRTSVAINARADSSAIGTIGFAAFFDRSFGAESDFGVDLNDALYFAFHRNRAFDGVAAFASTRIFHQRSLIQVAETK